MNSNDILVTAYPKSGITYLGFLLTAARLHHNHIRMVPTMYNIDTLLVDEHKMHGMPLANIWKDGLGIFQKSHGYMRAAPNVIYLLRNPVDAIKSYRHFTTKLADEVEPLNSWLSNQIPAWCHHVNSWLIDNTLASQSIFVTKYEDLVQSPHNELALIFREALGLNMSSECIDYGVMFGNIKYMRGSETFFTDRNPVNAKFDLNFVRKGDTRELDEFTPDIVDMINDRTRITYGKVLARLK